MNHYYLYLVKEEQPDAPIENHYFAPATRARSSASPAPACSQARPEGRRAALRRVPPLRRGPALLRGRGRGGGVPAHRRHRAEGGPAAADELQGPDVDLSSFGRELERDARAAARDRLPRREREGARAGGAPLPLVPRGGRGRRALLLPLAYLVIRAGAAAGRCEILASADAGARLEHGPARRRCRRRAVARRRPARLARRTHGPPGPPALGRAAALPLVIPSYVAAFCLLGFFGPRGLLARGARRRAAARDPRATRAPSLALTLSPTRTSSCSRRPRSRTRPCARGGVTRPRPSRAQDVRAGHVCRHYARPSGRAPCSSRSTRSPTSASSR